MKFYSEVLNKVFDTEQDLLIAEKENEEKQLEAKLAKEKRAERAKEVEVLFEEANEAYKKANEAMNEFVKEYGSFHFSITDSHLPKLSNSFDSIFSDWFWKF